MSTLSPMAPPAERRRRNRAAMRAAILAVALEEMRLHGVAGLSLHAVARGVNLKVQSLYKYFPSKAALYEALFQEGAARLRASDQRVWDQTAPEWDRIAAWLRSRLAFAQEHGPLYQLVTGAEVPGFVPSDESLAAALEIGAAGTRALEEMRDAGVIGPHVAPRRAMNMLLAVSRGITAETLGKGSMLADPERFDHLISDFVAAFRRVWSPERR